MQVLKTLAFLIKRNASSDYHRRNALDNVRQVTFVVVFTHIPHKCYLERFETF